MLSAAAASVSDGPRVDLLSLDADGARWQVSAYADGADARTRLYAAIATALSETGIPLGRAPAPAGQVVARTTAA